MGDPQSCRVVVPFPFRMRTTPPPPVIPKFGGPTGILSKNQSSLQVEPVRRHPRVVVWWISSDPVRAAGRGRPDIQDHHHQSAPLFGF